MIHDLSFPRGGASVNSTIPDGCSTVTYELLDDAIHIVQQLGRGSLIAKADIESAFRLIPIHPASYRLTGFTWKSSFFYDKVLPFGASTSCRTFELFSTAIQWILGHHFQVPYVSHIIDDFMFFGPPQSEVCRRSLSKFMLLADDLHLPVKTEKTVLPSTQVELHGIKVDTAQWSMSLPEHKLHDALAKVSALVKRRKVTLKELQSTIGTLNFATKVVVPGRVFLRRLIDLTKGVVHAGHHIRLNREARADLEAWRIFLLNFNGTHLFPEPDWTDPANTRLHIASAPVGFAVVLGNDWFKETWPASSDSFSQTFKDLVPIATAIRLWAKHLVNKKLVILCPNKQCCDAVNNTTSRDTRVMSLLRPLVVSNMLNNIQIYAVFAPNATSPLAQRLAHFQADSSRTTRLLPQTPVPPDWLSWR